MGSFLSISYFEVVVTESNILGAAIDRLRAGRLRLAANELFLGLVHERLRILRLQREELVDLRVTRRGAAQAEAVVTIRDAIRGFAAVDRTHAALLEWHNHDRVLGSEARTAGVDVDAAAHAAAVDHLELGFLVAAFVAEDDATNGAGRERVTVLRK